MKTTRRLLVLLSLCCALGVSAQETKLHWFGHAAFSITTPGGRVLLIDPWLRNPLNSGEGKPDPLASLGRVDFILLTHGHRDHVGDSVEIAKKTGATLVCNPELASNLIKLTGFPAAQAQTDAIMGIGGEIHLGDGEITIAMSPAVHSSSVFNANAGENEPDRAYGGNPAGFVIMIRNGPTIYHSGDTAYFRDMETIGEEYAIDVALLNIGGHYGMEPHMAVRAAKSIRAKLAVPHHFATSDGMTRDASGFLAELKKTKTRGREMKVGETLVFVGSALRGK
jgi:L-ascorbate metabolism protein UlaG (beta-lactamase superfamily)